MWLLKFHLVFSLFCFLIFLYVDIFFSKAIKQKFEKYEQPEKPSKTDEFRGFLKLTIGCFIPIINILFAISMIILAFSNEKTIEKIIRSKE